MTVNRGSAVWLVAALIALAMPLPSDDYYSVASGLLDAARGDVGHGPAVFGVLTYAVAWGAYTAILGGFLRLLLSAASPRS